MSNASDDQLDRLNLALKRELRTGERILWKGQPSARPMWAAFGIYLIAIPWTAFALFWTAMAGSAALSMSGQGGALSWGALAFPLFGTPFIGVGIGMLAMPFWPMFLAPRTIFAVTTERLIKLVMRRSSLVSETVPADRIGSILRHERSDGVGSLRIGVRIGTDSDGDARLETFLLGEVEGVMDVEVHIETMKAEFLKKREKLRADRFSF